MAKTKILDGKYRIEDITMKWNKIEFLGIYSLKHWIKYSNNKFACVV